jgi:hypothetical protein
VRSYQEIYPGRDTTSRAWNWDGNEQDSLVVLLENTNTETSLRKIKLPIHEMILLTLSALVTEPDALWRSTKIALE